MRNAILSTIAKLWVPIFVTAFSFYIEGAFAKSDGEANQASRHYCESLLSSLMEVSTNDQLLAKIDEVEAAYIIVQSDFPSHDLRPIRAQIDQITGKALDGSAPHEVTDELNAVLQKILALYHREVKDPVTQEQHFIDQIIDDPNLIEAQRHYKTNDPHISVVFNARVLSELSFVNKATAVKLFRAINKGFIGPHAGPGILRVTNIHKDFVEVKFLGGGERLLGCLENGVLIIKRLISKRNESGSLSSYKHFCD